MESRPAPRTARDFARIELTRAILDEARRQLADVGPAQLSVRAVARELKMASSAVYRYFPSRDDLITALLISSYDESGAAVERADAGVPRTRYRKRWLAITTALRGWAIANHHEYALLYGSPVPGYAAPQDTIPPAQRVTNVLIGLMLDVVGDDGVPTPEPVRVPRAVRASMAPVHDLAGGAVSDDRLVRMLIAWSTVVGQISLELFGHLHNGILDYETHFEHLMERVADDLGL